MKELAVIEASGPSTVEQNQTILFPYSPTEYWNKIRFIIRDEIGKKEKASPTSLVTDMPGMTYKPLYKVSEVCSLFSVSRQTVYLWIDQGILKPHKVRSRVYFLWTDIELLIGRQKHV